MGSQSLDRIFLGDIEPGVHELMFRLDSYSEEHALVRLTNFDMTLGTLVEALTGISIGWGRGFG